MIVLLKIVHLLSLAVALGMTTANLVTMRYAGTLAEAQRPAFGPLGRSFGAFGVMAVALLWVTGIALLLLQYDVTALSGWLDLVQWSSHAAPVQLVSTLAQQDSGDSF